MFNGGSVVNCSFVNCSAESGGAICICGGSVSGCDFINCSVLVRGGAIYMSGGSLSVSNSTCISVVGDEKAPIYNDYFILSPVVITTLDGETKDVALGDKVNLTGTITTGGMRVAGGILTIGINTNSFDVESDDNGLYSVEYTVGFKGTRQVSAEYMMVDNQSVICGEIGCRDDVVVSVDDVKGFVGEDLIINIRVKTLNDEPINECYIILKLNGLQYHVDINNCIGTFKLPSASEGEISGEILFSENNFYKNATTVFNGIVIKRPVTVTPTVLSTTYDSGKYFQIKVVDNNQKAVSGLKLTLKVYTGSSYKTVYVTTDANGIAKYSASKLSITTHKVVVSLSNAKYVSPDKTSSIKVSKAPTTVTAKKVTYKKGAKKIL